jgi:hypothetical protein
MLPNNFQWNFIFPKAFLLTNFYFEKNNSQHAAKYFSTEFYFSQSISAHKIITTARFARGARRAPMFRRNPPLSIS